MCDLHSQVVRDILVEQAGAPPPPGHPVDTFRRENEALRAQAASLRTALEALAPAGGDEEAPVEPRACSSAAVLLRPDGRREALPEEGAPPLLLPRAARDHRALDRDVGQGRRGAGAPEGAGDRPRGDGRHPASGGRGPTVAEPALAAVEEMIFKEERILLPMSLQNLTETEWGEIFTQSPSSATAWSTRATATSALRGERRAGSGERRGRALRASPSRPSPPARARCPSPWPAHQRPAREESVPEAVGKGLVVLPTGVLSLEQLKAVFATLPVDVTFVDADDRVRFFSEGKDRVFARPKAILGRLVQHCHPPGSVDVVERILSDFRSGRQDVAEFWIDFKGRFAHIRYFALRDEKGAYLGTLEVTQDLTRERALRASAACSVRVVAVTPGPRVAITPATKVAELLESWPELERCWSRRPPPSGGSRTPSCAGPWPAWPPSSRQRGSVASRCATSWPPFAGPRGSTRPLPGSRAPSTRASRPSRPTG